MASNRGSVLRVNRVVPSGIASPSHKGHPIVFTRTLLVTAALLAPLAAPPAQAATELSWKFGAYPAEAGQDLFANFSAADGQLYASLYTPKPGDHPQPALHRSGPDGEWAKAAPGAPGAQPGNDLLALGADNLYQAGGHFDVHHFDGKGWTRTRLGQGRKLVTAEKPLWGSTEAGVYVAGRENLRRGNPQAPQPDPGVLFHRAGSDWREVKFHTGAGEAGEPQTVWGAADQVFLGASGASVYHLRNGSWTREPVGLPANWEVSTIGGTSATDVWAVANPRFSLRDNVLLHSTGNGTWRRVARLDSPAFDIAAVEPGRALLSDISGIFSADLAGNLRQVHYSPSGHGCRELTAVSPHRVAAICESNRRLLYGVR